MRRIIVVVSVSGAPGVTTTALALAHQWPGRRAVLVEADPKGGDVTAWAGGADAPGLLTLAAGAHRRRLASGAFSDHVQILAPDIPVVRAPANALQAEAAIDLIARDDFAALRGRHEDEEHLIVDIGRITRVTTPLIGLADDVLLVLRGGVDALAHAAGRIDDLRDSAASLRMLLVGPSPYQPSEIVAAFGVADLHTFPWDAAAIAHLTPRRGRSRRPTRAPLFRAAARLATQLAPADISEHLGGESPWATQISAGQPARIDDPPLIRQEEEGWR